MFFIFLLLFYGIRRLYFIVAADFSIKSLNPCEVPDDIFNDPMFK